MIEIKWMRIDPFQPDNDKFVYSRNLLRRNALVVLLKCDAVQVVTAYCAKSDQLISTRLQESLFTPSSFKSMHQLQLLKKKKMNTSIKCPGEE